MPSSAEQASVSSAPKSKSWDYQIERFSGDEARNEKIGERRVAVDALCAEPLDPNLLGEIDERLIEYFGTRGHQPAERASQEEKAAIDVMGDLRGITTSGKSEAKSLDNIFGAVGSLSVSEQRSRVSGLRAVAEGMRRQAEGEGNDKTLRRLAEVTRLRADMAGADLFMADKRRPVDQKQEVARVYGAQFRDYAQTDDIPDRFKQQLVAAADSLEKHSAAELPAEETPNMEKLFGQEGGVTAKDVEGIKGHLAVLLAEPSPKNAFEAARVLAHAKRAGIKLKGGRQKVSDFLEQQRVEIQKTGPRALAQYLAYCKYTGLGKEATEAEGKWLLGAIHERLQKDPTHAGLSRLAMNVRYLNVPGYSPELVRQGVQEEVEALHQAQKLTEAVEEAARARRAGVKVTGALVEDRAGMVGAVVKRCRDWAENNQWDKFARLRASAGMVWGHTALDEGAKRGLLKYFDLLRFQAEGHGKWEPYMVYAADVRDLSKRDARLKEAKIKEISGEQVVEWLEQDLSPDEQHKARNIRIETSQNLRRERERRQESTVRRRENAILTEQEYEEYLGGPVPAAASQEAAEEPDQEAPDWQEVPQEPVVTGGLIRRLWGWLTGRRERRGRSSKTPTDTAA